MKVKLLIPIGLHDVGTIIDVDDTIVMTLERSGSVERVTDVEDATKEPEVVKQRGNPNFKKK